MFKIGEFSKLTQVSVRMLRYYDETGLLKPAEIDKFTSYRLYSTEQISVLNRIIFLRDLDFNVSEIAIMLSQWGDEFLSAQLGAKYRQIEDTIKAKQNKLQKIEQAKKDIEKKKITINFNVSIKSIPSCKVLSLRRVVANYYAEGDLWQEMSAFAKRKNIHISNTFTIYHDADYREKDVDVEVCAQVERAGVNENEFNYSDASPVNIMACTVHVNNSLHQISIISKAIAFYRSQG